MNVGEGTEKWALVHTASVSVGEHTLRDLTVNVGEGMRNGPCTHS